MKRRSNLTFVLYKEEIGTVLGVEPDTASRLLASGQLGKPVRIGRRTGIRPETLQETLKALEETGEHLRVKRPNE